MVTRCTLSSPGVQNIGREPKYLTFCASQAIDVFMLLKEGVLTRDPKTDVVSNTYFCEEEADDFSEITRLIGAHEQGFLGDFKELILFQDDETTEGLHYDDESQRHRFELRKKLDLKKRHEHLRATFPFDIVNLDVYGTFFPPRSGVASDMLKSIQTFLDWQTEATDDVEGFTSFAIFLTTHVEDQSVHPDAFQAMINMMHNNSVTYAGFSQSLNQRFGTDDVNTISQIDFNAFYCTALPKVIVSEALIADGT